MQRLRPPLIVAALLAVALVTWIVTMQRMRGMDAGPGTDLGGLGWFVGVWVTMAWTAYGLAAYGLFRALSAAHPGFLAWDRSGPLVAGAAVTAAGAYQLTPLKRACLRHCRTPLHFVMHRWRRGPAGALAMGLEHGAWCLGCCVGLMLVLFAIGVMSLAWMALVALLIFAEKVLPRGERLTGPVALCLIALGAFIALAPGRVPGLTQPGSGMSMSMRRTAPGPQGAWALANPSMSQPERAAPAR